MIDNINRTYISFQNMTAFVDEAFSSLVNFDSWDFSCFLDEKYHILGALETSVGSQRTGVLWKTVLQWFTTNTVCGAVSNHQKPRISVIFWIFHGFLVFFRSKNTVFTDVWRPVLGPNQRGCSETLFCSDLPRILYSSTELPPKIHNFLSKSVFDHFF